MSARLEVAWMFAAATVLAPASALAFCRTTTCDPNKPADNCQFDGNSCLVTGKPLAWRSSCVTFGVHELGSPSNGLSADDIADVMQLAFSSWLQADCGDGTPSIDVQLIGQIECGLSEYNQKAGNANVVLVREDEWPYIGAANAIGLTTTRFDKETGDLWDADIELNGVSGSLSIGEPITGADLLSVLTHETGHFLGLGHTLDATATMKTVYDPGSDGVSFRTLAPDDVSGICSIYPPNRKPATASCENRHGFSTQCGAEQPAQDEESQGCSQAARAVGSSAGWLSVCSMLTLALVTRLARRRRLV